MTDSGDFFPTYLQWLAEHSDNTLTEFFSRIITITAPTTVDIPTQNDTALGSLLNHLNSTELAVLHAAAELDAGREPATVADFTDTLTELFDIANTPDNHQPQSQDVTTAAVTLMRLGLLYSPAVSLDHSDEDLAAAWLDAQGFAVVPQVSAAFDPGTNHLWRLVDANRNPLPANQLEDQFHQHPDRQRAILRMLHSNGGVGHSAAFAPGANPDHPLARMLNEGLLDRLDNTTVRVTGRLQQIFNAVAVAPPGGVWTSHTNECPGTADSDSVVARLVQQLSEWSDALSDLATEPITPLNHGGIGIREIRKIANRTTATEPIITEQLTYFLELGLLSYGATVPAFGGSDAPLFALSDAGLDFLEADLATQWFTVIDAWLHATYAPWLVDGAEIRIGQPEAYDPHAAQLRAILPQLLVQDGPELADMQRQLWHDAPFLAWTTTHDMWQTVLHEAHVLGLATIDGNQFQATAVAAMVAAGKEWASDLHTLLPAPVDTLITQGDHTILAPGPLAPEDGQLLAAFATKESSGIATVWRVTIDTIRRALSRGHSGESILDFLISMAPGNSPEAIPQSLRYLVMDAAQGWDESLEPTATPRYHIDPDVAEDQTHTEEAMINAMLDNIHTYREWLNDQDEVLGLGSVSTAADPTTITELLRTAAHAGHCVEVRYANSEGTPQQITGTVVMLGPTMFSITSQHDGSSTTVHPHRLIAARLLHDIHE